MLGLKNVTPTDEQLKILARIRPGFEKITGAAGSGKTTTALLRLRSLIELVKRQRAREKRSDKINVLVLTFNRTLCGYIADLLLEQTASDRLLDVKVSTFANWALDACDIPKRRIIDPSVKSAFLLNLSTKWGFSFSVNDLEAEVDYIIGRFGIDDTSGYLTCERIGRGNTPRFERETRLKLLDQIVGPYLKFLKSEKKIDWGMLACKATEKSPKAKFDIAIIDEVQDFSTCQLKAVKRHLADTFYATLVLDGAQRIYRHGILWREVGINFTAQNSFSLSENYRNTRQIAEFCAGLLEGMPLTSDSESPNFRSASSQGAKVKLIEGKFSQQIEYIIRTINSLNLASETVAILHPLGGRWLDEVRRVFRRKRIPFCELQRQLDWPNGPENIGLSTIHSVKGLEFDHVFVVGLNNETTPAANDVEDDWAMLLRRALAMAIGRARISATIGYKPEEASWLTAHFKHGTYKKQAL